MTISCLALADSTGAGEKCFGRSSDAYIGYDKQRNTLNVVSPGAALCKKGQRHQPSLASLIADPYQSFGSPEPKHRLQSLLHENPLVKVISVKADESVPWTSLIAKRYEAMVHYRKDLGLIETRFSIMSLSEEFINS